MMLVLVALVIKKNNVQIYSFIHITLQDHLRKYTAGSTS